MNPKSTSLSIKLICLFITAFFSTAVIAQSLSPSIGSTLSDLKENCRYCVFKKGGGGPNETTVYYTEIESGIIQFFFEPGAIRNHYCVLIPKDTKTLNDYIKFYNENFVIISEYSWKYYYPDGMIINVGLKSADELSGDMKVVFVYE